jgi:hypothetical protein
MRIYFILVFIFLSSQLCFAKVESKNLIQAKHTVNQYLNMIKNKKINKITEVFSKKFLKIAGGRNVIKSLLEDNKENMNKAVIFVRNPKSDSVFFMKFNNGVHSHAPYYIVKKIKGRYLIDGTIGDLD